jgi:hypothetical protein
MLPSTAKDRTNEKQAAGLTTTNQCANFLRMEFYLLIHGI